MATDSLTQMLDPLHFWRKALGELESSGNTLSNQVLRTPEGAAALNQITQVYVGLQGVMEKALAAYLKGANLPSRAEVLELAERLQRIEDKVDALHGASPAQRASEPRPARTRKPPSANVDAATAPAAPVRQPSAPAKRGAGKTSRKP